MLKLAGAIMIIVSGVVIGFREADKLRRRKVKLEKIIFALKLLESKIMYEKRDIKTALLQIGESQNIDFLMRGAERIEKEGIGQALFLAVEKYENDLLGTDKNILKSLWENIGMSDGESQTKTIRHILSLLEGAYADADAIYKKNGRLMRSMGFLGGAFIVILLI